MAGELHRVTPQMAKFLRVVLDVNRAHGTVCPHDRAMAALWPDPDDIPNRPDLLFRVLACHLNKLLRPVARLVPVRGYGYWLSVY